MDNLRVDPARTALLVMDFQKGIIGRVAEADALVDRAAEAIAWARANKLRIGYVRVALTDAERAAVPATNKSFSSAAANSNFGDQSPETAIDARLAPQDGDIVVRKRRVGAFSTTDLAAQLGPSVDTLILAGISTSGVVLSTIRDAADHDYRLIVLEDACADTDSAVHDVLMHKVFPRQAYVIRVADVSKLTEAA
jgi:nicotinamidase-related amidase